VVMIKHYQAINYTWCYPTYICFSYLI